jgi:hypothetical protein
MNYKLSEEYKNAPLELSLIDANGKPIPDPFGLPYRFAKVLTKEEWEDGLKNGFEKYSVKPFDL